MTDKQLAALQAEFQRVFTRLFQNKEAALGVHVVKVEGSETVHVAWNAGGWKGAMQLERLEPEELSAKDVGAILSFLRNDKPS